MTLRELLDNKAWLMPVDWKGKKNVVIILELMMKYFISLQHGIYIF